MSLALTLLMVIALYSTVEAAATGSQLESQDGSQKAAGVDDEDAAQFLHSVYKTPYLEAVVEQPAESYISWNSVNE